MKKNSLKKINKFVCCLVILSLFLQFVPARQPAQATWLETAGKWIEKLVTKIALPDITLDEKGNLNVGSFPLADTLGCAEWEMDTTKNPPVRKKCIKPVNPFSQFRLSMDGKEVKSQIALVEPVIIPGCGEMTAEIWSKATEAFTSVITPGSISEKFSNDFITKKITGCTATPCLESEDICSSKDYKGYANLNDRVNCEKGTAGCDDNSTCYKWYMGNPKYGNEEHVVMNKENDTWRLYWEYHLGEILGTFENIKKARDYYVSDADKAGAVAILEGALKNLSGHASFNEAYNETNPKYKDLRAYAIPNIKGDGLCFDFSGDNMCPDGVTDFTPDGAMKKRHEYFIKVMTAMIPSLKGLASLNNITLNWWDARIKIKSALAILDAEKAQDLAIFGLTIEEIRTISAKVATLLEKAKASPACINPIKGELTIPKPYMPEICELSIPLPGDNKCEGFGEKCESKILAKNKACVYLNRLQESASQEVYSAFKIFNATDPFTDCLFVRNCRTNCSLRLGELTFTVSLLDVAALFVPGGFLTVVQKILNIAKMINQAFKIYTTIKEALKSGVTFLNDLFKVMGSLSSMYASFTNLGLNWSDMLIYGAGSLASQYGGTQLKKIGVGEGGNIGWLKEQGGNALSAGDGLLGGVAAVAVLNIDKVGKATNDMQDMLGNFAQNNLKFSAAKTAAIKANEKLKKNVDDIRQKFKAEPEFSFFFEIEGGDTKNTKKKELNSILDDFYLFFESVSAFLGQTAGAFQLKDGTNISTLNPFQSGPAGGTSDDYENWYEEHKNDGDLPIEMKGYWCTKNPLDLDFSGVVDSGFAAEPYNCYFPDKVYLSRNGCIVDASGVENRTSWLNYLQQMALGVDQMASSFKHLDPDYIKQQIVGCKDLICFQDGQCSENSRPSDCSSLPGKQDSNLFCYGRDKEGCNLDIRKDSGSWWRVYWQDLARIIGTTANIVAENKVLFAINEKDRTDGEKTRLAHLDDLLWDLYAKNDLITGLGSLLRDKPLSAFTYQNIFDYTQQAKMSNGRIKSMKEQDDYIHLYMPYVFPPLTALSGIGKEIDTHGWIKSRDIINAQIKIFQSDLARRYSLLSSKLHNLLANKENLITCVKNFQNDPNIINKESPYWTNAWWHSSDFGQDINTVKHYLQNTYPMDAAYEDWDAKIEVLDNVITKSKLDDVQQALILKVSPEKPIVVYKIAQAQDYLTKVKQEAEGLGVDGLASFEELAKQIIDAIIASITKTCIVPNQDAFDNYKNCCGAGLKCGEGWAKATATLNGRDVFCKQCTDNCKDCSATCQVPYDKCLVSAVNDSQDKATQQAVSMCSQKPDYWQCYNDIYNSLYDTFYAGYSGGCKTEQETCQENCVGGFVLNQECLNKCNSADGACGKMNFYQNQIACFDANGKKYKQGYDDYTGCQIDIENLKTQRATFAAATKELADTLNDVSENLKDAFSVMQKDWAKSFPETSPENQESQTAKAQIDKILKLKTNSEDIIKNKIPDVVIIINATDIHRETIRKIVGDANKYNLKKETIDLLTGIANGFDEATRILNEDVINFAYEKIGPKGLENNYKCSAGKCAGAGENTFLCRLKCFEEDTIKRTFEQLITYTDILRNVENAAYGLTQAGENIKAIEPSMDMKPVVIKPNLVDEVDERAQCCKSDCKTGNQAKDNKCEYTSYSIINDKGDTKQNPVIDCSTNGWTTAKCKEKTSLYVGQPTGASNYQFFKDNLLANPLSTLEDRFKAVSASVDLLMDENVGMVAAFGDPTKNTKGLIKDNNVYGKDKTKREGYTKLSDEVLKQARYMWWDLIWGNEDISQELLPACNITEQILTNDPADIQRQCEDRTKKQDAGVFVNTNLLPPPGGQNTQDGYDTLKNQCKILTSIDLDVLDNLQVDSGYIDKRITELNAQRSKGTKEYCSDNTTKDITCPKWFCLNQETFTWGAGAALVDPFCQKVTRGEETGRIFNDIVWDTGQFVGIPTNTSQIKPEVCELAGIGYDSIFKTYSCTKGELDIQCGKMMSTDITAFDRFPDCHKSTEVADIEKLKQEMSCIAVEGCNNGYRAGTVITKYNSKDFACVDCPEGNSIPSACLKPNETSVTYAILDDNPATKYFKANGLTADSTKIKNKCQEKQNAIDAAQTILNAAGGGIAACPWDAWVCQTKESCINLQTACQQNQDGTALKGNTGSGNWVWPPDTKCDNEDGYARGYQGAQNLCISTQQEIINLNAFKKIIDEIGGVGEIDKLTNDCNNLNYQKDFARDCYDFSVLQKALDSKNKIINENWKDWNKGPDDFTTKPPIWIDGKLKSGTGIPTSKDDDINNTKKDINGFCRSSGNTKGKVITETINSEINNISGFFNCSLVLKGLNLVPEGDVRVDLTAGTPEAQNAREVALKLCSQSTTDMRTPLNEIMKVFSVLLGVKSGTASMNGLSALYFDAQKIRQRAQDVIALIKEAPKKFEELWNSQDEIQKISKDNVDIKYVKCIAGPMISYASGGKALTGENGGQVCPNVGEQFGQLDSSFSAIRQNLRMIDMARIQPTTAIGFGNLSVDIPKIELIDQNLNEVVGPIYERAKEIKEKSQLLWALATAINYANENCTCGQSYCPQLGPVPLCISGLPLTINPLTQPFCHLIWTLRYPLGSLAEKLKQELETK